VKERRCRCVVVSGSGLCPSPPARQLRTSHIALRTRPRSHWCRLSPLRQLLCFPCPPRSSCCQARQAPAEPSGKLLGARVVLERRRRPAARRVRRHRRYRAQSQFRLAKQSAAARGSRSQCWWRHRAAAAEAKQPWAAKRAAPASCPFPGCEQNSVCFLLTSGLSRRLAVQHVTAQCG
jgi:hypothetical protein